MKVIVKGAYGTRNFGDDLLMLVMYKLLRQFKYDVDFLCPDHPYIKKLNININLNSNNSNKNYDICVYGGGTQFFHFKTTKTNKVNLGSKILGNLVNPKRMINTITRKFNSGVTANSYSYLGIGLGPFEDEEIKKDILLDISRAEFISLRDKKSIGYSKGYVKDVNYGSDLCFSAEFDSYLLSVKAKVSNERFKVGIILRDWVNTENGKISESVIYKVLERLAEQQKDYIFIFFSAVHDKNWIQFCKKFNLSHIVWDPDNQIVPDFLNELSSCDAIVSSRFHGLVISSLLSIPFVSLEIEPKLSLFSEKFKSLVTVSYPFLVEDIIQGITQAKWTEECNLVVANEKKRAEVMTDNFNKFLRSKIDVE